MPNPATSPLIPVALPPLKIYTTTDSGATWSSWGTAHYRHGIADCSDGSKVVAVEVIKVSTKKYNSIISSNALKTKYTITATKKGAKTLTFTGITRANGGATLAIVKNLSGYKFVLKLGAK